MKRFIRNSTIALVSAIFFMSVTCNDGILYPEQSIILNNQTDEDIMYFSMLDSQNLTNVYDLKSMYNWGKILSSKSATVLNYGFRIKENGCPVNDCIHILIIRRPTLDKYPFDYLLENNIYDDYLIFSYDELKLMDFQIIYKN